MWPLSYHASLPRSLRLSTPAKWRRQFQRQCTPYSRSFTTSHTRPECHNQTFCFRLGPSLFVTVRRGVEVRFVPRPLAYDLTLTHSLGDWWYRGAVNVCRFVVSPTVSNGQTTQHPPEQGLKYARCTPDLPNSPASRTWSPGNVTRPPVVCRYILPLGTSRMVRLQHLLPHGFASVNR
jgi:hypothetical protein